MKATTNKTAATNKATAATATTPAPVRTRGPRPPKTPITAADALPGITLLPIGITETDPIKAIPLLVDMLNAAKAENTALDVANKWSSAEIERLAASDAYLKTVAEALDCKDPAKLAEKAQKLQGELGAMKVERKEYEAGRREIQVMLEKALLDLKESQGTALSLQQDLTTQEGLTSSALENLRLAEQGRDAALLDSQKLKRIEEASGPFIEATRKKFGALPENCSIYQAAGKWQHAFESEFNRCEREIQEGNALRSQLTKAEQELRESQAALKLANASIESLQRGNEQLGREVDTLTDEVGRLTPRLSPWARIAFAGLGLFIVAYWSHRMGFDAAMALRGGAR